MTLKRFLGVGLALSVAGGSMADSGGGLNPSVKTFLKTQKLISVATKRANGDWSRPAPVWFAHEDESSLLHHCSDLIQSSPDSEGESGPGLAG